MAKTAHHSGTPISLQESDGRFKGAAKWLVTKEGRPFLILAAFSAGLYVLAVGARLIPFNITSQAAWDALTESKDRADSRLKPEQIKELAKAVAEEANKPVLAELAKVREEQAAQRAEISAQGKSLDRVLDALVTRGLSRSLARQP